MHKLTSTFPPPLILMFTKKPMRFKIIMPLVEEMGYIQSHVRPAASINAIQGPPISLRTLRRVRFNHTRHTSSVSHKYMSNLHYTALLLCRLHGPRLCLWSSTRLSTRSRETTRCSKLAASPTPLESASAGSRRRCWPLVLLLSQRIISIQRVALL